MKIEIDTHTHTILSGHAHSTLIENAQCARKAGLKGFVVTDHGPEIQGAAPEFIIGTYYMFPGKIHGVRIYKGTEANITNFQGDIDITAPYLKKLDFVIASLHDIVIDPGTKEQNTAAILGALNNPYVDAIGHPGNPYFEADYDAVTAEAKRLGKLLEINNHSFTARKGSLENCSKIIRLCKENGVRIVVSSDAHICFKVGAFENSIREVEAEDFPKEMVVNRTVRSFEAYLSERKERILKVES